MTGNWSVYGVAEDRIRSRRMKRAKTAVIVLTILVGLGVIFVPAISSYWNEETVTTEVISKERVCSGSTDGQSTCEYLVFTEAGTFKIVDSLILGRFSSSDVYGRIREGHVYTIVSVGWRIPFLSEYPNIKSIEESP